jgi:hypothetical protein
MDSEKTEIIDFSGEKFTKFTVPCAVGVFLLLIFVILNIYLTFLFPNSYITLFVSLLILFGYCMYYTFALTKNPGIRKFSISLDQIEIIVPNMPEFLIYTQDFEKIEIRLKKLKFKPYLIYELHFVQKNSERVFSLSLLEFSKEKIDQIVRLLKDYIERMGKKFSTVKETWVSGVVLVENLKI